MTNQDDKRVAEAVEDKPEGGPRQYKEHGIPRIDTFSSKKAWHYKTWPWWTSRTSEWQPRPFITAPTWELEGIVKEWLQNSPLRAYSRPMLVSGDIWMQHRRILCERSELLDYLENKYTQWDVMEIQFGKVGDWALALLEVLQKID